MSPKFDVTFRPYPAGSGSDVHDETFTLEGHCQRCALDIFYEKPEFNPEWRVVEVTEHPHSNNHNHVQRAIAGED